MAECIYCTTETELYLAGKPICIGCADARVKESAPLAGSQQVREILVREVFDSTARTHAASEQFNVIMGDIPSAIPSPDSSLLLRQASRDLSEARKDMLRAHSRLNDFLNRGVIPEDLKSLGGDGV